MLGCGFLFFFLALFCIYDTPALHISSVVNLIKFPQMKCAIRSKTNPDCGAIPFKKQSKTVILSESFGTYWTYLVVHPRIVTLRVIRARKVHAGVTFLPYLLNLVLTDAGG